MPMIWGHVNHFVEFPEGDVSPSWGCFGWQNPEKEGEHGASVAA